MISRIPPPARAPLKAYAISMIAKIDWPAEWPDLFSQVVDGGARVALGVFGDGATHGTPPPLPAHHRDGIWSSPHHPRCHARSCGYVLLAPGGVVCGPLSPPGRVVTGGHLAFVHL